MAFPSSQRSQRGGMRMSNLYIIKRARIRHGAFVGTEIPWYASGSKTAMESLLRNHASFQDGNVYGLFRKRHASTTLQSEAWYRNGRQI